MSTIPTIAEVLDGLVAGRHTRAQALVWIELHIGAACEAACDEDAVARLAMQTLMADQRFLQQAKNANQDAAVAVAEAAYAQAAAMKKARSA